MDRIAEAAQHRTEVLQPITNTLSTNRESVLSKAYTKEEAPARVPLPYHLGLFTTLPEEVLRSIVTQLASNNASLQNLSLTCQGFARLFRDKSLWQQLIFACRGQVNNNCNKEKQASIQELHSAFALRRPVQHPIKTYALERFVDAFGALPHGTYQLHLHKRQHQCFHQDQFLVEISSGSDRKGVATYYELMYNNEHTITTHPFLLDPCNIMCHVHMPPAGLQSLQLQKLQKGDLVRTSPEFIVALPSMPYPDDSCSAGVDENGNALFVSIRSGSHAEVGRSGVGGKFLYGRYGSYREESAPYKNFQGRAAWPGLLVNLAQSDWIMTTMSQVHSLRLRAVHLGEAEDGSLHACRVLFRGWHQETLASGQQSAVMRTTGHIISVLPGKFVFGKATPDYAMFTWKGKATGGPAIRLGNDQEIQLLCYKVFWG